MNNFQINAIITRALTDPEFRKAILNGHRRERLQDFNLSPELVEAIMAFKVDSLRQFIFQMNDLVLSQPAVNRPGASRRYHVPTPGLRPAEAQKYSYAPAA